MMFPRAFLAPSMCALALLHVTLAAAAQQPCATQWLTPGLGVANSSVAELLTLANGDVVAGGTFTSVGGVPCNGIARWNGVAWSPMGTGLGRVEALAQLPNGDVVAGGFFTVPGPVASTCVARWNGSSWLPMGSGLADTVFALTVVPNGDVVAGGIFGFFGGPLHVARWDGTSWLAMGNGVVGPVSALTTLGNGDVVAGWSSGCSRWNGTTWSLFPSVGFTRALRTLANGDVLVAGGAVARIDGAGTTHSLGFVSPVGSVESVLELPDGDLLVGGVFTTVGGVVASNIARWNGTQWSPLASGTNGSVNCFTLQHDAAVLLGGAFTSAGPHLVNGLAAWHTTCPASVVSAGAGCAGSGGPNVLVADNLPWTGSTLRTTGTGMPAVALVSCVYGFTPINIPWSSLLPQGGPGCDLLVSPDFTVIRIPIVGVMRSDLVLPTSAALGGQVFFHQMIPIELSAALAITSVTATNALILTIGTY